MDNDWELTSKADALMGKHGATRHTLDNADDRNIPVLTDVLVAPDWQPPPIDTSATLQQLSDAEIDALSHDVFTRVYGKLDRELATRLEDRIAAQLANQINLAISDVITDMRQEIANEIGDAVNAALADKLRK